MKPSTEEQNKHFSQVHTEHFQDNMLGHKTSLNKYIKEEIIE